MQIDPSEKLDSEVEDVLVEIAEDFVESVSSFAHMNMVYLLHRQYVHWFELEPSYKIACFSFLRMHILWSLFIIPIRDGIVT